MQVSKIAKFIGTFVGTSLLVLGSGFAFAGSPSTYQTANMVAFGTGVPVGGAGTLVRSGNEVHVRLATSDLMPGEAYTVWWVIWNKPELCVDGCGEDDLGINGNSVVYAAGFVTGDDGTVNLTAHLKAGKLPAGIDVVIPGGLSLGKGLKAEFHIVVRNHGPILPGSVDIQIGTFNGACDIAPGCTDEQAVVFLP